MKDDIIQYISSYQSERAFRGHTNRE